LNNELNSTGFLEIDGSQSTIFSMILFFIALFGKEAVLGSKYKLSLSVSTFDFLDRLVLYDLPLLYTDLVLLNESPAEKLV